MLSCRPEIVSSRIVNHFCFLSFCWCAQSSYLNFFFHCNNSLDKFSVQQILRTLSCEQWRSQELILGGALGINYAGKVFFN
jgi:hypothetical protein